MFISASDGIRLASKLTPKKLANMWNIWSSYQRSKRSGIPNISGSPWSISIEPTTACNLGCPECPSGLKSFTRPTGKLSPELFSNAITQLSDDLLYLIFYFQGEPYLHPDFLQMVAQAESRGVYTATSTNAHFLSDENARKTVESGLSRLIISIDGSSQETYESYRRNGSLDKVLEGTKNILKWRKKLKSQTPAILWQFLVVKPNEHEIPEIQKMAAEYGVDKVAFKTAQIYDYENGNDLIPTIDKYSRYRQRPDGRYELKGRVEDNCWKMWHSCVITWDGRVVPCCFDKDAQYVMGDMNDQNFKSIWNGEAYDRFRRTLFKSRQSIEICQNCTEGAAVWA